MLKKICIGMLTILLLSNMSLAAVELKVTPVDVEAVSPGGSIDYEITVEVTEDLYSPWQEEIFSISDKQSGWNYNFNPESVTLYNNIGETKSSILTMTVPNDAPIGLYSHTVVATGYDEFGKDINVETEVDTFVVNTPIEPIPELNTGILTSAGMIGLILILRKYKK